MFWGWRSSSTTGNWLLHKKAVGFSSNFYFSLGCYDCWFECCITASFQSFQASSTEDWSSPTGQSNHLINLMDWAHIIALQPQKNISILRSWTPGLLVWWLLLYSTLVFFQFHPKQVAKYSYSEAPQTIKNSTFYNQPVSKEFFSKPMYSTPTWTKIIISKPTD